VDNDIEIVGGNPDDTLVYDRGVSIEGKYADMAAADRELKLRGYEGFRFGHDELKRLDAAQALLREFFPDMLCDGTVYKPPTPFTEVICAPGLAAFIAEER